jgi:hypothetical protein
MADEPSPYAVDQGSPPQGEHLRNEPWRCLRRPEFPHLVNVTEPFGGPDNLPTGPCRYRRATVKPLFEIDGVESTIVQPEVLCPLLCCPTGDRLQVQIRHFDQVAVRQLGRDREFALEVTSAALAEAICAAIAYKNRVDSGLAAQTHLLLISPYPLPLVLHPAICSAVADRNPQKKYLQTWVASRREPAFRVQG